MAQRAKFAGSEAGIGIFVLGLFFLLGLLGFVGTGILIVTGEVARDPQLVIAWIVGGAALGWWGWSLGRDLRNVRVVEITEDGTWILKGPLGMRRGTIPPGARRGIGTHSRKVWIFGVPRRYEQSWVEIDTPGRTWRTCASIPEAQVAALQLLRAWIKSHPVS